MSPKQCPICGLYTSASWERCDCGYDFATAEMKESFLTGWHETQGKPKKKRLRYRIVASLIPSYLVVLVVLVVLFGIPIVVCGSGSSR
jgi:hypothetical protein